MIPEIIAHLQANTTSFPTIENAWTMEPVEDLSAAVPALYLYPGEYEAQGDASTYCRRQLITLRVEVFLVCRPDDFRSLFLELWNVLLGYQVDRYHSGLELERSATEKIVGHYLWRRNTFGTNWLFRAE